MTTHTVDPLAAALMGGPTSPQLIVNPGDDRTTSSILYVVGTLSGKIDQLLGLIPTMHSLDDRVTKLEIWQGYIKGALAIIVFLFTGLELIKYAHIIPAPH